MSPVAAITGATKGLGLALACELVAHGYAVAGCGTSTASVAAAAERLGPGASLRVVDVADPGAVSAWAGEVADTLGAPDLVIANAGVVSAPAPIWDLPPSAFASALAVNVGGVAHLARAFLPAMIARRSGTFVAMSSGWGRRGKEGLSPYCASKFAVEGLVQSVALEVPAGVRVVSLDPGNGVRTAMLDTCLPDELDIPYPSPAAWASQAIAYLLDDVLGAPNGSALKVPGIVVARAHAAAPDTAAPAAASRGCSAPHDATPQAASRGCSAPDDATPPAASRGCTAPDPATLQAIR
jgi:NAD(P)-dependent dehydrogenase (short-subunit alcohol dehydrogenase family)